MKHFLKEDREITSVDTDLNLETKLSNLFLMFQEVSSRDSEKLGIGKADTIDKGLRWVITRFEVEIINMPKYGDNVSVITYPGDNNPLFFYRHFVIEDKKHNVLVRASSVWAVINANTHQVVKDPFHGKILIKEHLDDELPVPSKIEGDAQEFIYKTTIRYSDIDLNSHLNNTRYIELIQNAFDLSFYQENIIERININYLAELRAGDTVEIYSNKANPCIIVGRKDDKNHFVSKITYKNR